MTQQEEKKKKTSVPANFIKKPSKRPYSTVPLGLCVCVCERINPYKFLNQCYAMLSHFSRVRLCATP